MQKKLSKRAAAMAAGVVTMGLEREFAGWCEAYVLEMLRIHSMARPAPRVARVWGCQNASDFFCGFFVGEMIGGMTVAFQTKYRRDPSAAEHDEITGIIEEHGEKIRQLFSGF